MEKYCLISTMMKRIFSMICAIVAIFSMEENVFAQEDKDNKLDVTVDVASGIIWRGIPNNMNPVVIPSFNFKPGRFSIGAGASIPFSPGEYQEISIFAEYEILPSFKVCITDFYWYCADSLGNYRSHFNYNKETTSHAIDLQLFYEGPGGFKAMLSTIIAGADLNSKEDKNNYSTYLELDYGNTFKNVDWDVCAGFVPMKSGFYGTSGANFVDISTGVSKKFEITSKYSLPVSLRFIVNPATKLTYFVVAITLF